MGCCQNNEINSVVENFHHFNDKQLIGFIEKKIASFSNSESIRKDYSKLNDSINIFDDTLLHFAVYHKRYTLIKYLVEKGANAKLLNTRKKSPLDIALHQNDKESLKLLGD